MKIDLRELGLTDEEIDIILEMFEEDDSYGYRVLNIGGAMNNKTEIRYCAAGKHYLPLTNEYFFKNKNLPAGLGYTCRKHELERQKEARTKNPGRHTVHKANARKRNKLFVRDYLSKHPCVKCGCDDFRALVFHHRNPAEKKYGISYMANVSFCIETIMKEIDKCDVLCANCHMILHYEEESRDYDNE